MNSITEDFVSFETAKLLKEKGFDEQTLKCYNLKKELCACQCIGDETINSTPNYLIAAPTLQMVMKWLREEHFLFIEIDPLSGYKWTWSIWFMNDSYQKMGEASDIFSTYKEASEEAIKYCLENLI